MDETEPAMGNTLFAAPTYVRTKAEETVRSDSVVSSVEVTKLLVKQDVHTEVGGIDCEFSGEVNVGGEIEFET